MSRGTVEVHPRPRPSAPARWGIRSEGRALARRGLVVLGVVAALLALRLLAPRSLALGDGIRDAVTLAVSVVVESLPFVFLEIALSTAVQLWLQESVLLRLLPRRPVPRWAALSLLGVLLPVCECGNVPLARCCSVESGSPRP